ncbi:hypothetical protein GCM10009119_07200 [Algoriphagus jejuensis]|uniref:Uncharacterized protein n=1 Tax=Algoriphagus jejuensis TaxID=419934 RepID=A0ABP3YA71_9BACT
MNLLPIHNETLVSALSKKEVLGQLSRVTREVNFLDARTQGDHKIYFNGMIGREGFHISRTIKRGDSFLPLMTGEIASTPRGSIIFVKYSLFPTTVFFLAFWSMVLLAFAGYYFFAKQNLTYGSICLGLAVLNYCLGIFFFHRQVKASKEVFHDLINLEMKGKE